MLRLKIKEVLQQRGIATPHTWLRKECKISPAVAARIFNGTLKYFAIRHLDRICVKLDCTIDELVYWEEDNTRLPATHALLTRLQKPNTVTKWNALMKKLDGHALEEIYQYILAKSKAL